MALLDPRTVFLITGLMYIVMPLLVWVALREQKNPSVTHWCLGGEVLGLGLLLIGVRNHIPDWLSYDVALLALYSGCMLRLQALRMELQRPLGLHWLVPLGLVLFAGYELGLRLAPEGQFYYAWAMLTLAGLFAWTAWLSRRIAQQQQLRNAHWLSGTYLPLAVVIVLRVLMVITGNEAQGPLAGEDLAVAVGLLGILTAVMGNTSFLGFHAERASRQQMQEAEEQARRQESARLGRQIVQLDRQRSMGLLAASLAHELSQPLTNINLMVEIGTLDSVRDHGPDSEYVRLFADIRRNANNALDIMERIRGYIKAREMQTQRVELQEVVNNVQRLMNDWLRHEHVRVERELPEAPVCVQADAVQLAQILVNLLRNAGQATAGQSERRVRLLLRQQGGHALLQVQDNGPGFADNMLQGHTGAYYTTKSDGLGVGLSISRHIAEQHQGTLTIGNTREGGAIVTLTLPSSL